MVLSMMLALILALVWAGSAQPTAAAAMPAAAPQALPDPETTEEQMQAAKEFAGPDGKVSRNNVLVKHSDGEYEWIVLCVGRKPDGATALIDSHGRVHDGGIDDFRAHNDLLSEDDEITFNRDIASSTPGNRVKLVTLSGHTGRDWTPWLIAGSTVAVLAGGALLLVRRARRAARGGPTSTAGETTW
ncbi:hypothetical protein ABT063_28560 [Streptomyces sp. NPDC002838]|uniref:hypothetical protein n=1 Tax=Streptomyces sp. NPDC002838 TaxID=3154436 RepID=UPI003323F0DB